MGMLLPSSGRGKSLGDMAWAAYASTLRDDPVAVLPVGAIEQHGPHLPITTDAVLAAALAQRVAETLDGVVVEPIIYGSRSDPCSGGGEGYPGTISLRPETLLAVASDVIERLARDGLQRLVILNAHYENATLLREASRRACSKHSTLRILFCNWWDILSRDTVAALYPPGGFPGMELEHGALLETSLMLHLAPELVGEPATFPAVVCEPLGYDVFPESPPSDPCSGALAPANSASAEVGDTICREVVAGIVEAVGWLPGAPP